MTVRLAAEDDIYDMAKISRMSLSYSWSEADFLDALKSRFATVLVASDGLQCAGYIVFYRAADEGEITSVAVDEKMRRGGIAKSLFNELVKIQTAKGLKKMFLEVRQSNDPAQKFYESVGFLRVGNRRNFYDNPKEDAYIMMWSSKDV